MKKLSVPFMLSALLIMSVFACNEKLVVICPDGKQCFTERNPEKSWPEVAKSHKIEIATSINMLDKIKAANLDDSTKSEVVKLREKIDQANAQYEIIVKPAYMGYNKQPWSPMGLEYSKILNELAALGSLSDQLNTLSTSSHYGNPPSSASVMNAINKFKYESNKNGSVLFK